MRVTSDLIHISSEPYTDDGTPAEPEQQTVTHAMRTEAAVDGTLDPALGQIPASIVTKTMVDDFVKTQSHPCFACRYWDQPGWQVFVAKADGAGSPWEVRNDINKVRAALLSTYNAGLPGTPLDGDGELDVENVLANHLGFCHAFDKELPEGLFTHAHASCPPSAITETAPYGRWKARDRAAEKYGNKIYDTVLAAASGKHT